MRYDLEVIASLVEPGATVLDLGCGEGDLLDLLRRERGVKGSGIEKHEDEVSRSIARGLTVLQGDFNQEIADYADGRFDYVILSQTLQQVFAPDQLLREMLRVGRRGIVSFPNFGHWAIRLQLLLAGVAPISRSLPYEWYDTPNIRVITLKDFRQFARKKGFRILTEIDIDTDARQAKGRIVRVAANLRATYGIFLIGQQSA
ncbi:MAG: methionine biosynthesis protein MetW [Thermodesulfobacteriota bacterium]